MVIESPYALREFDNTSCFPPTALKYRGIVLRLNLFGEFLQYVCSCAGWTRMDGFRQIIANINSTRAISTAYSVKLLVF